MKFKLEIELGNDLMETSEHLAMALEATAKRIRLYPAFREVQLGIRDPNGNRVGSWKLENEDV